MGTKLTELESGCFHSALPDEPMFVLLARDLSAPALVQKWAADRRAEIDADARPASDMTKVVNAIDTAIDMRIWRNRNNGNWRKNAAPVDAGKVTVCGKQILRNGVELAQCANPDVAKRIADALNNDAPPPGDDADDQAALDLTYDDKPANCAARRVGDQMQCGKCGLQWDFNDPDAPACRG